MNQYQNQTKVLTGVALALLTLQVATAAKAEGKELELNKSKEKVHLKLSPGKEKNNPQEFTVNQNKPLAVETLEGEFQIPPEEMEEEKNLAPPATTAQLPNLPNNSTTPSNAGGSVAQQQTPGTPQPQPVVPNTTPDVLIPDPDITIDGQPAPANAPLQPVTPAPPFLPRAVAPPVGDIGVSTIDSSSQLIDLGTAASTDLVLRDAPVREVLSLLARLAGLNLVFSGAEGEGAEPTISLDIEDEPVQNVFNYVLQLSGLDANRRGRTIFVGAALPQAARNIVTRSFRLNQVGADSAATFLAAQGAAVQIIEEQIEEVVDPETQRVVRTVSQGTQIRSLTAAATEGGAGVPFLLRGLTVTTDARLNSITLVGEPRKVQVATSFLTQLDARRRQVAINVKIVDINLLGTDAFNASFSFGVGDGFFAVDQGAAVFNYGGINPPSNIQTVNSAVSPPVITNPFLGANIFLDPNNTVPITGTAPGTIVIDNRTGQVQRVEPRGSAQFLQPIIAVDDPLTPGFTNVTLATDNIITINPDNTASISQGTLGTATAALPSLFQFPTRFLGLLQAQITSGNAKILTDPTLVVQEGQEATVRLTQDVVGNIETETEAAEGIVTRSVTAEIEEAGLTLTIAIEKIDDNGFVSLSVSPTVTAIGNTQNLDLGDGVNQIALLNRRELSSGLIRLRDAQTLILSGIIQESDRTTVRKVPILGDIPILGALFRSTERQNQRQEVIVLLTPQIIDDSERASWGYNYIPGTDARQLLRRNGVNVPGEPR